jgi:hypothetical protein
MKSLAIAVLFLVVVAGAVPATANSTTYTWNFATTPNQSLGTNSQLYVNNGVGITATGSSNLYYKSLGLGETGLGLVCGHSCDHEIGHGQSIVFNLSSLLGKNVTGVSLILESLQPGETGSVCDGFGACVTFTASNNSKSVSILGLFTDMRKHHSGTLIVRAGSGDVLVDQLQVNTSAVPEPGSLLLMGSGLLGIVGVIRRRLGC